MTNERTAAAIAAPMSLGPIEVAVRVPGGLAIARPPVGAMAAVPRMCGRAIGRRPFGAGPRMLGRIGEAVRRRGPAIGHLPVGDLGAGFGP